MALFDYSGLNKHLDQQKNITLFCHVNPDGDCIGSSIALKESFSQDGHNVQIISPNEIPEFYQWLHGYDDILIFEKDEKTCTEIIDASDVLISIDHNSPSRIPEIEQLFRNSQAMKVMFDHHVCPDESSYHEVYSLPGTSSTAEIIYDFILTTNPEGLNKQVALGIYVGILTDTGSFSYSCNAPETFRIVAHLIEQGIVPQQVHQNIYMSMPEKRLRLLGFCISERLVVLPGLSTAYIWLSTEDQKRYHYKSGDAEGIVNYALSISGIRFAALFKEQNEKIRISFRSKGNFPANEFAKKYFWGGGHLNAAGGDSFEGLDQTLTRFRNILTNHYREQLK